MTESESNVFGRAAEIASKPQRVILFQYLQRKALLELHARGVEDGTDGTSGPALLTNHFTQVGRIDAQFQDSYLLPLNCPNRDLVRMIHKRFGDGFD
jgi:hypothetical protein